jgi:sporulation-control protein
MFKKILHKLGIGSAEVNLVLHNEHVRVGDEVTGVLIVKGGNADTQVDAIRVELEQRALVEKDDHTHELHNVVHAVTVATGLIVKPGEERTFPFRFEVPGVPQSSRFVRYGFNTRLDIPGAVDKHDFDEVIIYPSVPLAVLQEAIQSLGFAETYESGMYDGRVQEFEYKPHGGPFYGRLSEFEAIFWHEETGIRLYAELDRKARGILGVFGAEFEQRASTLIPYEDLESVDTAAEAIARFLHSQL